MKLSALSIALAGVYGMTRPRLHSAAWLWFDWTRDRQGKPLTYKWKF